MSNRKLANAKNRYDNNIDNVDYAVKYVKEIYEEARKEKKGYRLDSWIEDIEMVYNDVKANKIKVFYVDILFRLYTQEDLAEKRVTLNKIKSVFLDDTNNMKVANIYVNGLEDIAKDLNVIELQELINELEIMYLENPKVDFIIAGYALLLANLSYEQETNSRLKTVKHIGKLHVKHKKNYQVALAYATSLVNLCDGQNLDNMKKTIINLEGVYNDYQPSTELAILYETGLNKLYKLEYVKTKEKLSELYEKHPKLSNIEKEEDESNNIFKYKINMLSKFVEVLGFSENAYTPMHFKIPEKIEGYNVEIIGESAFEGKFFFSVKLPDTIREIKGKAFSGTSIDSITLPKSLTSLGSCAFDFKEMDSIKVSRGNKFFKVVDDCMLLSFDEKIFYGLIKQWSGFEFPENVTTIAGGACRKNSLETLIIPSSLTYIGDSAFEGCDLSEVNIPPNVTYIGDKAFSTCNLKEIEIPEKIKYIGESAFFSCNIEELEIPDSVTHIGEGAFAHNYIKSVKIPKNVSHLGGRVFFNQQLEKVELDERNKYYKIVDNVIISADGIELIAILGHGYIIPASVKTIGDGAFLGDLREITIKGDRTRFNDCWENIGFPNELKPIFLENVKFNR